MAFSGKENDAASTPQDTKGNSQTDLGVVLDVQQLKQLQQYFASQPAGVNEADFSGFVSGLLHGSLGELDLRILFMRIDVRGDGIIRWTDIVSFLLLGRHSNTRIGDESKDTYHEQIPFTSSEVNQAFHQQAVTSILCHPRLPRYFTTAEDGMVKMWNSNTLCYEQTIHSGVAWISGMTRPFNTYLKMAIRFILSPFFCKPRNVCRTAWLGVHPRYSRSYQGVTRGFFVFEANSVINQFSF